MNRPCGICECIAEGFLKSNLIVGTGSLQHGRLTEASAASRSGSNTVFILFCWISATAQFSKMATERQSDSPVHRRSKPRMKLHASRGLDDSVASTLDSARIAYQFVLHNVLYDTSWAGDVKSRLLDFDRSVKASYLRAYEQNRTLHTPRHVVENFFI